MRAPLRRAPARTITREMESGPRSLRDFLKVTIVPPERVAESWAAEMPEMLSLWRRIYV